MKVTLIDCTGNAGGLAANARYAAALLIFTKSTRLQMSPGLFKDILAWPEDKIMKELEYMANTIPSSWEFVHYTFMIEDVTRAFTHQLVRTRSASFAQQTMRVLPMAGWAALTGPSIASNDPAKADYEACLNACARTYATLISRGVKIEDARGILPTNILTNIVMGVNLRTLVEMVQKRSSPRVQGEYREVLEQMKEAVLKVHPWAHLFINRTFDRAAKDLDEEIKNLCENLSLGEDYKLRMMKLVDQLRQKGPQ